MNKQPNTCFQPSLEEIANSRNFWRSLSICLVLCIVLFWIPVGILAFKGLSYAIGLLVEILP